ncbi:MAG: MarR family winged helix-turn-helix transcriptional regulator [Saccharofermentanales bacterium]|jgi:DNA-binding MarR family transcriptional regulator
MKQKRIKPDNTLMTINLDGIEDRYYLFGMLAAFANRMQTVGDSVFEEITWKQWFALLGASILQPSPSISQVADFVGTSHQNMKRLLLRLESTGLVRLEKDEADLRRTLVNLTPEVEVFEQKYRQQNSRFMGNLFEGISDDNLATARLVLDQLYRNLRAIEQDIDSREDSV